MADRTSAELFADFFCYLAGLESDGSTVEPTARDKAFALELWKRRRAYDFSDSQMGCEEALVRLGLARADGIGRWLYGPEEAG